MQIKPRKVDEECVKDDTEENKDHGSRHDWRKASTSTCFVFNRKNMFGEEKVYRTVSARKSRDAQEHSHVNSSIAWMLLSLSTSRCCHHYAQT